MKSLLLVTMLSVGTALTTMGKLKPVAASLTPPASYDYSYTWNATASEQYLNVNGVDSIPLYTSTADGVYFNYTSTFNIIDGFEITLRFNRSNSTWQSSGIFYKPDEARIGSDNTVGTVARKWDFIFNNQTNKNYRLFTDFSSSPSSASIISLYNNVPVGTNGNNTDSYWNPLLETFYIPSYTTFNVHLNSGSFLNYFDAWYLKDLGISDSYQQGLDAETDGILTDYLGTDAQQIGWVLIGIAAILFAFKGGK